MAPAESETLGQVKYYLSQAQRAIDSLSGFKRLERAMKAQIGGTAQKAAESKIMGSISYVGSAQSRLTGAVQMAISRTEQAIHEAEEAERREREMQARRSGRR